MTPYPLLNFVLFLVAMGLYTALVYWWSWRRGRDHQLRHPRPEDAVWVPSTRPKPVARSRAQVTRAAYVERESGEEVQPTRVKKARMRRRKRTF